jgi:hypothetical protein
MACTVCTQRPKKEGRFECSSHTLTDSKSIERGNATHPETCWRFANLMKSFISKNGKALAPFFKNTKIELGSGSPTLAEAQAENARFVICHLQLKIRYR